jgi:hypothetical protein
MQAIQVAREIVVRKRAMQIALTLIHWNSQRLQLTNPNQVRAGSIVCGIFLRSIAGMLPVGQQHLWNVR